MTLPTLACYTAYLPTYEKITRSARNVLKASKFVLPFLLLIGATNEAISKENTATQSMVLFNTDWHYLEENHRLLENATTSQNWSKVSLPHTWNAFDTMDSAPGYRRSASWYQKSFSLDSLDLLSVLYFEGANFETEVYVNGQLAGEHVGGYIGFEIDMSPYVKLGSNEVSVRVSNAYNPNLIPSQKSDFFLFGGITRDVWLKHLPKTHIQHLAVRTPRVSEQSASTAIELSLNSIKAQSLSIKASIMDAHNNTVASQQSIFKASSGKQLVELAFDDIQQPALWSPDSPNLYRMQVSIYDDSDTLIHSKQEVFGYRWFEMRPHQGFFVNGKQVLIRGTHRHEEHAGLGAALSNEQHYKDMRMIKDMGANFVRLGHYPQDPEVYRAANELGLIIWDELPWCRGGKGGDEWEKNTEHLWQAQLKQNINHPSIAFWSLGNEIYWEEDFPGGGATELINPYLKKLNDMTKAYDSSRLTSIRKYYPGAEMVDAFSPSIWAGWYGGSYNQYEEAISKAHDKYPTFLHMEYGGSSHVGRHTETPVSAAGLKDAQVSVAEAVNQAVVKSVAKDTNWNENYIVDLFDWHLNVSENFENFAGNAQWAFKDFGTPLRPENPIPYMNQKGLVDRAGNFKDAYYVFASYWKKQPFCEIESKTWTHRNGPEEGRDVTVYCNTQSAELFLDGKSLGKKQKQQRVVPAGGLVWQVPFVNGTNKLHVLGFNADQQVAKDQHEVSYLIGKHGKFDRILLRANKTDTNRWLISAEAVDKDGNRVLDYAERANFFNIGDHGKLLENYGTPSKSSVIEMASGYASIEFEDDGEASIIEFRSQNVKGVYVDIRP